LAALVEVVELVVEPEDGGGIPVKADMKEENMFGFSWEDGAAVVVATTGVTSS
jgi:hypothetical protein